VYLFVLQVDQPITPQNKADIALNKTVSPPFEGNNQNSSTLLVGSEFTFRVCVEVQGERTNFAEKVVMTDNLPPGLQFVSLSEQPSNRGKSRNVAIQPQVMTCRSREWLVRHAKARFPLNKTHDCPPAPEL
jgi:uncharacterized repeat protein (TIGR01451 family)